MKENTGIVCGGKAGSQIKRLPRLWMKGQWGSQWLTPKDLLYSCEVNCYRVGGWVRNDKLRGKTVRTVGNSDDRRLWDRGKNNSEKLVFIAYKNFHTMFIM